MTPGVVVHQSFVPEEQPGTGGPLRASEIREAVEETIWNRLFARVDGAFYASVRNDLRTILSHQADIMGLPAPDRALWSVLMEVVTDRGANKIVVMYPPSWDHVVDDHMENRDCRRCGGLRTCGFPHTGDDCDLILARCVLDS